MRAKEILNKQQGVAEGATVTRIDSKPITDFASNLNTYKHTDDWSQSGLDTGDDSYWTKRNIKPNTSKGLFAGDPHRTALYATGNANETRYVEYTENGQPVVYFDEKDLPAIRARKTYLSIFDASDFRKLPSGEWFSEHPSKPIKQIPINDPFKYIESQGWKIRITNDLNKVLKKVQQLQKVGKIDHYGAEGMNESKQDITRGHLHEDVSGNYLYYSVESSDDAKLILTSGYIKASGGAQTATQQQTKLPVVSVSRSINYAVSGANVERDYKVVFVLDRNAIESRYKTFGTSQHEPTKSDNIFWNDTSQNYKIFQKYSKIDTNRDGKMSDQELDAYYAIPGNTTAFDKRPSAVMAQMQNTKYATMLTKYNRSKSGKEFEEVIPVKSGKLPLKGILVGFYLVPNKAAAKDQELLNHPMRLTMPRPNTFVKVTQQNVVEDSLEEIDRRGFLRGMGAAAATAAGPGMAQTIPDWQKKANIALQKGPAQKWPGYDEDDGKWPAAKNAPAGSLIAYRGDTRTGKLETLPTLIRKETVAQFLNAYKLCRDNKLLPSISPETWAALLLVEGRSDFGYNGPDILKKYSVTPTKQSNLTNVSYTANQNNENDKFGPKMDVNLNMTPIRQGLKKLGISENDWRADFCELLSLKIDTARRLGIPFYQAWNGGTQFLNRYRLQMQAIKDPKNKPLMDFIRGILGGGQGVAEGTIGEGSIPVYKSPSQFYAGAGKTLYKLFRNAFPNLPEHVANDIYNQTSPGTNDTIVNALKQGQDPKSVFLNYYSGITFNFSKDPGTSLTPQQMKTVLLNGRWRQKILTVNPADFAEHSRNRMVKRNFGINPDEDPTRIQRQQSRAKGDGSNEPVIIIQTSNGLILWEGFHRTMSILALGKNGEDPLRWNKVKLRAWVVEIPNQQGVAEDWSEKYKKSINCKNPKGFSQRAHCQGRKKNNEQVELDERKRKRKKKTARYYYGPAYYFGATDTGAEGGDGGGLEEDWKKSLANVGIASAIGLGAAGGLELKDKIKSAFTKPTAQTIQQVQPKQSQPTAKKVQPQQVQVSPITNNPLETYLMNVAKKSGLTGIELAQFLGQCAHETLDYKRMIEKGTPKYFNKYELKFSPDKAKNLGNNKPGDGIKYKGRGYIQLTGRYNYKMAGKALNLPLEQNPELAAQPDIAAKIALWYWGQRVRPEIKDFADTTSVTRKINSGLSGLEDRHENFLSYIAQR